MKASIQKYFAGEDIHTSSNPNPKYDIATLDAFDKHVNGDRDSEGNIIKGKPTNKGKDKPTASNINLNNVPRGMSPMPLKPFKGPSKENFNDAIEGNNQEGAPPSKNPTGGF